MGNLPNFSDENLKTILSFKIRFKWVTVDFWLYLLRAKFPFKLKGKSTNCSTLVLATLHVYRKQSSRKTPKIGC